MPSFRLVHTSDWHLGHTLHGFARGFEHTRFLDWLDDQLAALEADALIVTGDIFDKQNPPTSAAYLLYRFVAGVRKRCPALDIVLIGGNHDSAGRLEAPQPLLDAFGVRVIGSLPRDALDQPDTDRLLVPMSGRDGTIAAWCAAVPHLRPSDLPPIDPQACPDHPVVAGTRAIYGQVAAALRARARPGQARIVTGHCTVRGATLSEMSERHILVGGQHAVPADAICPDADYVALGHLHRPQTIGGNAAMAYAGSPIALATDERPYRHRIVVADFRDGRLAATQSIAIPRWVELLRVPPAGVAPLAEVLDALPQLITTDDDGVDAYPFLEVAVAIDGPVPDLRQQIEAALADKPVRLTRITPHYPGDDGRCADALALTRELAALTPEDVFAMRYRQRFDADPDDDLLHAFRSLVAAASDAGDAGDAR